MKQESELLKSNLPCENEDCLSSDALALYSDGHTFCFSCSEHKQSNKRYSEISNLSQITNSNQPAEVRSKEFKKGEIRELKTRKISKETCAFYGVETLVDQTGKPVGKIFPFFKEDGSLAWQKIKKGGSNPYEVVRKDDTALKESVLFGQQLFPKGCARYITITEGEDDALAAYEMSGSKYPVVSIKNGAQSAVKDIRAQLEYLESFENIYICFDNDKPGKETARKVVKLFSPLKARVVNLTHHKDASDYKQANDGSKFISEWWKAEKYTPSGLVLSSSLKDKIREKKLVKCYDYPFETLNKVTYGLRTNELVVVTAQTGQGKTQVLREIEYKLLLDYIPDDVKIGAIFIEEVPEVSAEGLLSLHLNKRLHLPDTECSKEDWERAFDTILKDDRIVFYDAFGTNDVDTLIARIRWMNKSYGCQFIFLDHISMLVASHQADERKTLDYAANEFKKLTMELGICIICVAHLNREGEIRGTSGIEKVANIIFKLEREHKSPNTLIRNTTQITVEKNRFSGETGPAGFVFFDCETGRLAEIDPETFYAEVAKKEEDFSGEEL